MHRLLTSLRFVPLAALAMQAALAQTFVVDVANGPGTNFTDLGTATAAVPSGAVLVVRPGVYGGQILIHGKSLTVLAEPDAKLGGSTLVSIQGIAATQSVFVRGLQMQAPPMTFGGIAISCQTSAGPICLENMTVGPASIGPVSFEAAGCSSLWLRGCSFSVSARFTNCDAVLRGTYVQAFGQSISLDAVVQSGGSVQLVDCIVTGRGGFFGNPAVQMTGGTLRLLGGTTITGGTSVTGPPGLAIAGTGTVRRDLGVTLSGGGTVVAPTITVTTVEMPRLTVDEVLPAGTVETKLHGPIGHAGFVLVSLTGPSFPLPFLADSVWIDPLSMLVVVSGIPGPGAPVAASISMPAVSTTLGFQIVWQGLTLEATAGFQISNAEYNVVH